MDLPLLGTTITGNLIQKWLSEYYSHESPVKIASCKAEKIGENKGFTSTIARVTLEYDGAAGRAGGAGFATSNQPPQQQRPPKSVVFKTLCPDAMKVLLRKMGYEGDLSTEAILPMLGYFHKNESALYKVIGKNKSPIPIPRIYKITDYDRAGSTGVILMEDLRGSADGPLDTISLDKLYQLVEELADLHAWSWKNKEEWSDTIQPSHPDIASGFADSMRRSFMKLEPQYRDFFKAFDVNEAVQYMKGTHESEIYPNVIVHGDYFAPNFIFEPASGGTKLAGIVDWGLCHAGCGMEDLARLLTMSVDTELRRERTVDILKRYYDSLAAKVGGLENLKASFEDILRVFDRQFVFAALSFVMLLNSLLNLFVHENGADPDQQRKMLFDRCVGVYEDFLPIWKEIQSTTTTITTAQLDHGKHRGREH